MHSAAGGIEHLAQQIARLLGAGTVVATAGSEAKLEFAREHGVDVAGNHTEESWADQARAAVPGGSTSCSTRSVATSCGAAVVTYGATVRPAVT
ncbi:zinc-binding dehydrogenase [Streptomyces sp. NPDC002690]